MPQWARLWASQAAASRRPGGRLLSKATVSGGWPATARRRRAAWAASGKPAASALIGALCRVRVSCRLLLASRVAASVLPWARVSRCPFFFSPGAGGSGKKGVRRFGHVALDGCAHGGLVAFDGEQVVGAVFEHECAARPPTGRSFPLRLLGGLVLGVQGVEAHHASVEFERLEEFARHRDLPAPAGAALRAACGTGRDPPK